jgi:curved DNA-binding protein CbpA
MSEYQNYIKADYYAVLGVRQDCDDGALKGAFRKKAMDYHPDRHPGDKNAEEKFKAVSEAYTVLSNPAKRSVYDQIGGYKRAKQRRSASAQTASVPPAANFFFDANFDAIRYPSRPAPFAPAHNQGKSEDQIKDEQAPTRRIEWSLRDVVRDRMQGAEHFRDFDLDRLYDGKTDSYGWPFYMSVSSYFNDRAQAEKIVSHLVRLGVLANPADGVDIREEKVSAYFNRGGFGKRRDTISTPDTDDGATWIRLHIFVNKIDQNRLYSLADEANNAAAELREFLEWQGWGKGSGVYVNKTRDWAPIEQQSVNISCFGTDARRLIGEILLKNRIVAHPRAITYGSDNDMTVHYGSINAENLEQARQQAFGKAVRDNPWRFESPM